MTEVNPAPVDNRVERLLGLQDALSTLPEVLALFPETPSNGIKVLPVEICYTEKGIIIQATLTAA